MNRRNFLKLALRSSAILAVCQSQLVEKAVPRAATQAQKLVCSICSREYLSDCFHFDGHHYEVDNQIVECHVIDVRKYGRAIEASYEQLRQRGTRTVDGQIMMMMRERDEMIREFLV
jgi:heterodisulfide reductase subunit A-like polyferredoxin